MIFKTPKISFFLRSNKDKANSYVLYCRVTFNLKTKEFSLQEKVLRSEWCFKSQRIQKNSPRKKYLDHLQDLISYKIKTHALLSENATVKDLINSIQQTKSTQTISLYEICKEYIKSCKSANGTIKNHEIKLKNLHGFINSTNTDFTPEQFTIQTAYNFIDWFCKKKRTRNVTTANRNVLFYRMCCIWYRKKGNKMQSELYDFGGEKDKLKAPVFLTADELTIFRTTYFVSSYLERIRDLFIFQCYTGLSYCDLWSDWEIKTEDFGKVLIGQRGKNGNSFWLPIEDEVVTQILEKYNGQLPKYCNAVYNRILKEIVATCGINKRVSTHTARKTFATMMDANGWTRETVSKMLGHSSVKTTEMYYLGQSFARLENEYKQRKNAV